MGRGLYIYIYIYVYICTVELGYNVMKGSIFFRYKRGAQYYG